MYFRLDTYDHGYGRESEEVEYGSWSEYREVEYLCAYIVPDNAYSDVALFPDQREPKLGESIYVVVAVYSSGDSFGTGHGYTQELWAFTDLESAYELRDLLRKDYETKPDYDFSKGGNVVQFRGKPVSTSTWKGWATRLDEVKVEILKVLKE